MELWKYRYRGALARARWLRQIGERRNAIHALHYANCLHQRMLGRPTQED